MHNAWLLPRFRASNDVVRYTNKELLEIAS
jgi:hypothetical protein